MLGEFKWITFSSVACSSIADGTSIKVLGTSDQFDEESWESGRFAEFPVELVIRLDFRIQAGHLKIASKPGKGIPEIEVLLGDGLHGSFVNAEYRPAGRGLNISHQLTQIPLTGFGSYLKLLFTRKPTSSSHNPLGQVSLAHLKVWGRPLAYDLSIRQINEAVGNSDSVDKVLMSVGMPLDLITWSHESQDSFRHAPVDEESRETLLELEVKRNQAFLEEDYGALKQLSSDIKTVFEAGTQLLQLKRELKVALAKEDYDTAIILKERIDKLQATRDSIDALYETARYQRMIVMGMPSQEHMSLVNSLLEEERMQAELLHRQQLEEMERRRREEEEFERLRRLEEMRAQQAANKKPKPKPVKRTSPPKKPPTPPPVEDVFTYNAGDADLEQYLRPKLNEAGGQMRVADIEILKRADVQQILQVVGVNLWSSIYSDNWRHRLAAFIAFLEFVEAPLLPKYQNDTRGLFRAAIELATISCEDRVLPVYLNGLKILITAMSSPICDHKVTPKMINEAMRIFIPILLKKVSELNYRARDISMHTLIELLRHPHVKLGPLIDHIMILTAATEGPGSPSA